MSDEFDEKELGTDVPDLGDEEDGFDDDEPLIPDGFHEEEPDM